MSKKDEYRRYLEKSGVIDALTKVLVGLYEEPERPTNALDYVKKYLGVQGSAELESLRSENEELKQRIERLQRRK